MCTVLLPPGGYPIAVNKYIISCYINCLKQSGKYLYHFDTKNSEYSETRYVQCKHALLCDLTVRQAT